jgi:hypothetical protein
MAVSFATTTTNLVLSFEEGVVLGCTIHTIGGKTANIYVNSSSTSASLSANSIYNLPELKDVIYFRINSAGNVTAICSYFTPTSSIVVVSPSSSTSTLVLPEDFLRIPGLIYVVGGLILFISALLFIDFLRRAIR